MLSFLSAVPFLAFGLGGTLAVLGGALALGIRHGIDWDHIAAITDITSATAVATSTASPPAPAVLVSRPASAWELESSLAGAACNGGGMAVAAAPTAAATSLDRLTRFTRHNRVPLFLGTMYALGHGSMVVVLGLMAILFQQFLPAWIDPIMERVVGVTLVLLAVYLFYSVFRYFRGGEFRMRSRWMLVFALAGRAWHWTKDRLAGRTHQHTHSHHGNDQYGAGTAYGIGLIHGIGAETGTQVLIIATAVGAGSTGMSVATLGAFVAGLLISNSMVTLASTTGFISSQRRQTIYVAVGLVAAVFSLVVGLVFLSRSASILPSLDPVLRWIGGPG